MNRVWSLRTLKSLMLVIYLLCDHQSFTERFASLGISLQFGLFLALYGMLAIALFFTAHIRNTALRLTFAIAFTIGSTFQHTVEWGTGGPLTYESFLNLIYARDQAGNAAVQYGSVLLKVLPISLLLFLAIALPPHRTRLPNILAIAAPIGALAVITAMFYVRAGEGARALPAAIPPVSLAGLMAVEHLKGDEGPRHPVEISRSNQSVGRDIVFLVDESVAGHYLDINNPKGVPTVLSTPPSKVALYNYGYAASIHTCSHNSNLSLRYGGTRDNYQETAKRYPSIWAYARQAGLRTVYIDAQTDGGKLQNQMTPEERAEIDEFIQLDGVPVVDRDMRVAEFVANRVNNGRHEFIYVNKVGVHFPIQNKFPKDFTRYQPVLPGSYEATSTWSSDHSQFHGTPQEWQQYRNSYRNALLWNVGEFFNAFLQKADLNKATVIYTSDHGQDLHERGNPGNNTHCGTDPHAQEEAVVPLLILESRQTPSRNWQRHLNANHNGMSHFRIFPTLLALMGYDENQTHEIYGPSLDDPAKDDFTFNVVYHTRLGGKPKFQQIDRASIVSPLDSDWNRNTHPHMASQD